MSASGDAVVAACLAVLHAAGAAGRITLQDRKAAEAQLADGALEQQLQSRSRHLGLRAILADGRQATVSTTDPTPAAAAALAAEALALAAAGEPDPWRSLPPAAACGSAAVVGLDHPFTAGDLDRLLDALREGEALARRLDPRIVASHRCRAGWERSSRRIVDTQGLDLRRDRARCALSWCVVAAGDGEKQMGEASTAARQPDVLRPVGIVVAEAVERAVSGLGWRRPPGGAVPVLFDPRTASAILGLVAVLAAGGSVYRRRSCWAGSRGSIVAAPLVTVVDDPLLPGGLGSRGCDQEGVRAAPLTVIRSGVLEAFLTDAYAARRLDLPCTGHADGPSNLRLLPGNEDRAALLARLGTGLLCTRLHGFGFDPVAGTWSKGAAGLWVEGGRIAHPVRGFTLAGTVGDLFGGIRALGNDLLPDSTVSAPSLLVEGLRLGGG